MCNRNYRRLHCKPRSNNSERQVGKKCPRFFQKTKQDHSEAQMPNLEELISQNSRKVSGGSDGEIIATKLDFDYAYGQFKLNENTKNIWMFTVTGGDFTGYYRFLKGIYGLADIPIKFQERIDTTLEPGLAR